MLKMFSAVALAIAVPAVAEAQSTPPAAQAGQSDMCAKHSQTMAMDHSKMSGMDMSKMDHSKMDHPMMSGMDMSKMDHSKMIASCHMPAADGSASAHNGHGAH